MSRLLNKKNVVVGTNMRAPKDPDTQPSDRTVKLKPWLQQSLVIKDVICKLL
jgi:hypothetical protein